MCRLKTRRLILQNFLVLTLLRRYNIESNHIKEPQYASKKKSNSNESDYYSALNLSQSAQNKIKQSHCVACYTILLENTVLGYSVSSKMSNYRLVA